MNRHKSWLITVAGLLAACAPPPVDPALGSSQAALTAAQCSTFAANGKDQICHKTGSSRHPYTILRVDEDACVTAHAAHPGDYIAIDDPTCAGGGCLPDGAPCDS